MTEVVTFQNLAYAIAMMREEYKRLISESNNKADNDSERKMNCDLKLSRTSVTLSRDNPYETVSIFRKGSGEITVQSDDEKVATAVVVADILTIKFVGEGKATITVSVAETQDYEAGQCAVSVISSDVEANIFSNS